MDTIIAILPGSSPAIPVTSRHQSWFAHSAAMALAVLYALIAGGGTGLHEIGHLWGDGCGDSPEPVSHSCVDCHRVAEAPAEEEGSSARSHQHGDDCALCQLLAQMRHADPLVGIEIDASHVAELAAPVKEPLFRAAPIWRSLARGPPSRA